MTREILMKNPLEKYRQGQTRARESISYKVAKAQSSFAHKLEGLLHQRAKSRSDLANAIGTSPAYVTKVLGGDANFTIETMVKLANALDADLVISPRPREVYLATTWDSAGKSGKHRPPRDDITRAIKLVEQQKNRHAVA